MKYTSHLGFLGELSASDVVCFRSRETCVVFVSDSFQLQDASDLRDPDRFRNLLKMRAMDP